MCTMAGVPDATWASYTDSTDPSRGIRCAGVDQHTIYQAWKAFKWAGRLARYIPLP